MGWIQILTAVLTNIPTVIKIMQMLPPLIEQIYDLIEKFSKKKAAQTGEPYKPEEKARMFNKAVARKVYKETGVTLPNDLLDDVREKTWDKKNPGMKASKRVGKLPGVIVWTPTNGNQEDNTPNVDGEL